MSSPRQPTATARAPCEAKVGGGGRGGGAAGGWRTRMHTRRIDARGTCMGDEVLIRSSKQDSKRGSVYTAHSSSISISISILYSYWYIDLDMNILYIQFGMSIFPLHEFATEIFWVGVVRIMVMLHALQYKYQNEPQAPSIHRHANAASLCDMHHAPATKMGLSTTWEPCVPKSNGLLMTLDEFKGVWSVLVVSNEGRGGRRSATRRLAVVLAKACKRVGLGAH